MSKVKFTDREYFGSVIKQEDKKRISLFLQFIESSKGTFPFIGLSEEYKDGTEWKYGKAVTFPPRLIGDVQDLINSINQDDVIKQTAPKIEKPEAF